jgi:hypothetical protein
MNKRLNLQYCGLSAPTAVLWIVCTYCSTVDCLYYWPQQNAPPRDSLVQLAESKSSETETEITAEVNWNTPSAASGGICRYYNMLLRTSL